MTQHDAVWCNMIQWLMIFADTYVCYW
jgi:hypothetical protein